MNKADEIARCLFNLSNGFADIIATIDMVKEPKLLNALEFFRNEVNELSLVINGMKEEV